MDSLEKAQRSKGNPEARIYQPRPRDGLSTATLELGCDPMVWFIGVCAG